MEKLPLEFTKRMDGKPIHYKQHERFDVEDRCVCIYGVYHNGDEEPFAFEVITPRLQKNDLKLPNDYISPAGEKYPSANEFGRLGLYIGGGNPALRKERADAAVEEMIEGVKSNIEKAKKKEDARNAEESSDS